MQKNQLRIAKKLLGMKRFIKSRWTYVYKRGDCVALFNSKNLEIFFVDTEVVKLLSFFERPHNIDGVFVLFKENKNLKQILDVLIKAEFLVSENKNEIRELKEQINKERNSRKREFGKFLKLNALRVVLTERCNLNCRYCFVQKRKGETDREDMSFTTLSRGIDLLSKLNKKGNIEIQFFGGEPLLKFELIKETVNYIKHLCKESKIKNVYYGITTNGILLTDEIAKFLKKHNFLVSVSIDGWDSLHNLNRQFSNGKGSFKYTSRGLKILQKNKNDIGILVTPTKNNVEYLAKACEYLIDKLKCKFITINTPQPINGNWDVDGRLFSQQIKKCSKVAEKYKAIINTFGTRVIYALNNKRPLIFSCSKFGNNYTATLTPDGKISPCIVSWNSNLTPINRFDYKKSFLDWKLTPPYFFKQCLNCPSMNVCGGPCPLEIHELDRGSIPVIHERCNFFNNFLEWAIWLK